MAIVLLISIYHALFITSLPSNASDQQALALLKLGALSLVPGPLPRRT